MSMPSLTVTETAAIRLADVLELTKPKIASLVLVTVAVASFVASWGFPPAWLLLNTLLGTALIAASASALNQYLERESDSLMPRTAERPLPAGRLTPRFVLWFGGVTFGIGVVYLALAVGLVTAALGLFTWFVYVCLYTPLKSRTPLNTAVGAVAGAAPVLMGWTAVGGSLDVRAFTLFLIIFLWQFPHFMAIAWMYRRDYALGGMKMLSVVDPSGHRAAGQAVVGALMLIPVSLLPTQLHIAGEVYFVFALLLGLAQLLCAIAFAWKLSEVAARRLLFASLLYLPALFFLLMLWPLV
jgi:protoheme IX farnesyltransferase